MRIKVRVDSSELDTALAKARELAARREGGPFLISAKWDRRISVAITYLLAAIAGWGIGIAQASTWLRH